MVDVLLDVFSKKSIVQFNSPFGFWILHPDQKHKLKWEVNMSKTM